MKTYQFRLYDGSDFSDRYTVVHNEDFMPFLDFLEEQLYILYELTPLTRHSWKRDMTRHGNCLFTYHNLEDVIVVLNGDTITVADLAGKPLYEYVIENRFTGELDRIIGFDIPDAFRNAGLCRAEWFVVYWKEAEEGL